MLSGLQPGGGGIIPIFFDFSFRSDFAMDLSAAAIKATSNPLFDFNFQNDWLF